ncbi:MAG: adenylate kinase [Dehalococcoidales bacterium]|nr:adenylate kinase [Dehalococcoidales bacterium]
MFVVLLGAPGAGKGTQAKVLSERLKLPHVASGDLFRAALANDTRLGRLARPYMESGQLVPDEITTEMVVERLLEPDCAQGAILDGYPRTVEQARSLDVALGEQGLAVDRVVYINVPSEELTRRLTGRWICRQCQTPYHEVERPPKVAGVCDVCGGELYQRTDDTAETVQRRLRVYFQQTAPLIGYYREKGILLEVNGQQGIQAVTDDVLKVLGIS